MTRKLTPHTDYGQFRCGEKNRNAKLTMAQVRWIRECLGADISQVTVAEVFGISRGAVSMINTGKTWGWLK